MKTFLAILAAPLRHLWQCARCSGWYESPQCPVC
jgi:hypothetical protein